MKASVAYKTLDNITVVMLAFKNFKHALSEEFTQINHPDSQSKSNLYFISYLTFITFKDHQDSGQVGSQEVTE